MISAPYLSSFPVVLPVTNGKGRLAKNGGWWMQFHSRTKHENLYVTVPCHGPVTQTRLDAPAGRHWPSDVDQILRDGWMDSDEAARAALAAAQEKDAADSNTEGQFELSSRANVLAAKVLGLPMRGQGGRWGGASAIQALSQPGHSPGSRAQIGPLYWNRPHLSPARPPKPRAPPHRNPSTRRAISDLHR